MSESNAAAELSSKAIGATDGNTLSKLHALIELSRGKRTWPTDSAKAAEELLAAAFVSPTSTQVELGNLLSLAQALPIAIIESLFEKHWLALPADRKEQLVSELLKLGSDKSQARQAAIAAKISRTDQRSAAYILQGLISSGKKVKEEDFWPQLSKEKKELLRGRFGKKEWVNFKELEEPVLRVLMAGFVEAMTGPDAGKGKKTQRPTYDFAKWTLSTLKHINIDGADRELVSQRVMELAKDFPSEWKKELSALAGETPPLVVRSLSTPDTADQQPTPYLNGGSGVLADEIHIKGEHPPSHPLPDSSRSREQIPKSRASASALEKSLRSEVAALLTRKQAEVKTRNASIELLVNDIRFVEKEVELIEQILDEAERSNAIKIDLESKLKQMTLTAESQHLTISQLESELSAIRKAHQTAEELSHSLGSESYELRQALDEEKRSRASETQELEEEIERAATVRLDGFKAQLARSLRPVFKNKKTTDDQEPSSRLSEFLRSWFGQVEAQLNQVGVDISKDG